MKKTQMLKKNYEFRDVLSKGKYYSGRCIEAFIKKNGNSNENFLGIAVSVKVGKANKRNYIKRLVRENYKEYEENIKIGYRIVFLWKKKNKIEDATFENVKKDMAIIFDKAKLLVEEN